MKFSIRFFAPIFISVTLSLNVFAVGGFDESEFFRHVPSESKYELLKGAPNLGVYPEVDRIVAFGDVHGDAEAMIKVVKATGLVDDNLNWIGKKATLVSMGDIFDRGNQSLLAMKLLMRWEQQAEKHGGRVITLLGNHELMVLQKNYSYFTYGDALEYYKELNPNMDPDENPRDRAILEAVQKITTEGDLAEWLARRPVAVTIGKRLFIHAGVEKWITKVSIPDLNETMSAWVKYYQKKGPQPSSQTRWIHDDKGPIWTRKLSSNEVSKEKFIEWLQKANLESVTVGHTPTHSGVPEVIHPNYGSRYMMIDAGMSKHYSGTPSGIEIQGNSVKVILAGPVIPRDRFGIPIKDREAKEIASAGSAKSPINSPANPDSASTADAKPTCNVVVAKAGDKKTKPEKNKNKSKNQPEFD